MRQHHFTLGNLRNSFFDRVTSDEPIDHDFVGLTDSVSSAERLNVIVRIPIGIVDNDGVSGGEIDTETSGSS